VAPAAPGGLLCALLAALPPRTALGLARYDDAALDATRWLAVTASALLSLLPVTLAMLADPLLLPCLSTLSVAVDYRSPPGGAAGTC
jgi:hypothetical protein